MRNVQMLLGLLLGAAWPACQSASEMETQAARADAQDPAQGEDDDGNEVRVGLSQIPQVVQVAARAAVPGLLIEAAELEDGGKTYCVHGRVNGVFTEVEVSADGSSTHVEGDDDEEDDEDDDDDDDGDEGPEDDR